MILGCSELFGNFPGNDCGNIRKVDMVTVWYQKFWTGILDFDGESLKQLKTGKYFITLCFHGKSDFWK